MKKGLFFTLLFICLFAHQQLLNTRNNSCTFSLPSLSFWPARIVFHQGGEEIHANFGQRKSHSRSTREGVCVLSINNNMQRLQCLIRERYIFFSTSLSPCLPPIVYQSFNNQSYLFSKMDSSVTPSIIDPAPPGYRGAPRHKPRLTEDRWAFDVSSDYFKASKSNVIKLSRSRSP